MTNEPTVKTVEEFQKELRGKFYAAIATALVAGAGAVAVGVWGYVKTLPGSVGLVPAGAIVAFDHACPTDGWERYLPAISRTVIGAAEANEIGTIPKQFAEGSNGVLLTARPLLSTTGEEMHDLTVAELPPHTHTYESEILDHGGRSGIQDATFSREPKQTSSVGDGVDFTNMQPSLALYYCRKLG